MNTNKVTELLKSYRAYRYAVRQYENHHPLPQAGVANYSGMPGGSGAPELFFDRVGKMADMGHTSFQDVLDYEAYKEIVNAIDSALDTLNDDQKSVIKLKWMDGVTLVDISKRKSYCERTIRSLHKSALANLSICLRFVDVAEVESVESLQVSCRLDKVIS